MSTQIAPPAPISGLRWFLPLLIVVLLTCMVVPPVVFLNGFPLGWDLRYFVWFTPLIALECLWSRWVFQRMRLDMWEALLRAIPELVVLIVAVRWGAIALGGWSALQDSFWQFLASPLAWASDPELLVTVVIVLTVWEIAHLISFALERLADPNETSDVRLGASQFLRSFVVAGGLWILLVVSMILGAPTTFPAYGGQLTGGLQLAVAGFFGACLLLLGYRQYLLRQQLWRGKGNPAPPKLGQRWARWGLILAGVVCGLALILPAGYSQGPAGLLNVLLGGLLFVYYVLFWLIAVGIGLFVWLLSLLAGGETSTPPPNLTDFAPPEPPPAGDVSDWWLLARQVLVIALSIGMLVVVVVVYLQGRDLTWLRQFAWLRWLGRVWQRWQTAWIRLWRRWWGMTKLAVNRLRAAQVRPQPEISRSGGFGWLRANTAQARVRRYYLLLLGRAERSDLPRQAQQTPQEYAAYLTAERPDLAPEIDQLTDAFTQARYANTTIDAGLLGVARRAWSHLQRQLRQK